MSAMKRRKAHRGNNPTTYRSVNGKTEGINRLNKHEARVRLDTLDYAFAGSFTSVGRDLLFLLVYADEYC